MLDDPDRDFHELPLIFMGDGIDGMKLRVVY